MKWKKYYIQNRDSLLNRFYKFTWFETTTFEQKETNDRQAYVVLLYQNTLS